MPPDDAATVVVVAHPDDEVLGAGGWLQRHPAAHVLHMTDGAPADGVDARAAGFADARAYAAQRRREATAALSLAGHGPDQVGCLGAVDKQASLAMPALAWKLAARLLKQQAVLVLTHAYEGGHPDHDATAFIVHAAAALFPQCAAPAVAPQIFELASYHGGGADSGELVVGRFLAAPDENAASAEEEVSLSDREVATKRRMLAAFATQRSTLDLMTAKGDVARERFRPAPRYVFTAPPHAGALAYETSRWGGPSARGTEFRERARLALRALALEEPL
jgi:LmbE family N-acetylglucosaminyl deacetylase